MEDNTKLQYKAWKTRTNGTKADFELINKYYNKFEDARLARMNNCYWFENSADDSDSTSNQSRGNWKIKWERHDKQWSMWYKMPSQDNFEPNIKSPKTFGRVESFMNKVKDLNIRFIAVPKTEKGERYKTTVQAVIDHYFDTADMKRAMYTWFKGGVIHGTSIARLYFTEIKKEVSLPEVKVSKKDKASLEQGKVIWKSPETVTTYRGVVLEPIPIYEFFPDPMAVFIHGLYTNCRYVVRRKLLSYSDFMDQYKNDPNAQDVDKVMPVKRYRNYEDYGFFRPPEDLREDGVQLLEFEDSENDKYIIIANDILIKNTPLPYNHKEITYQKIDCVEFPNQFYSIGFADVLENIQAADEILNNLIYKYIYETFNRTQLVDSTIFGQYTYNHLRAGSKFIPIEPNGQPISARVATLPIQPIGFDIFRMLDIAERNATMATQLDPSAMAIVSPSASATQSIQHKEVVEMMIRSVLDNYFMSLRKTASQMWEIIRQLVSVPEVRTIIGENGETMMEKGYQKLRLQGYKVNSDGDLIEDKDGVAYFEMKGEFLNQDFDFMIDPQSARIVSEAIDIKDSREVYAQLMPNAVDASDPNKVAAHPNPMWDSRKVANWYAEKNFLPKEIILNPDKNKLEEIEVAVREVELILKGEYVPGVPGRSKEHNLYETNVLRALNKRQKELEKIVMMNPMAMIEMQKVMQQQRDLAEHTETDALPVMLAVTDATSKAKPPQMQNQGAIPNPEGSNIPRVPQMQGGEMNGLVNNPQMAQPAGVPGRPPMASVMGGQ